MLMLWVWNGAITTRAIALPAAETDNPPCTRVNAQIVLARRCHGWSNGYGRDRNL
jgi:hypothetical protein